jgi:eukaryotic-like serine/threonine-protein kinase
MIGACGEVMVMDWGLATRVGTAIDTPGSIIGTPMYMAPEQARCGECSERSDIYSASVLFYELLTLRHYLPENHNVLETLSNVETTEPVPARFVSSAHQTNVPPELSFLVARGMQKDPAARYGSVTDMIAALTAIHRGDIRAQCPRTFLKRMTFRAMRFSDAHAAPALILAALALVVFVCGIASATLWLWALIVR